MPDRLGTRPGTDTDGRVRTSAAPPAFHRSTPVCLGSGLGAGRTELGAVPDGVVEFFHRDPAATIGVELLEELPEVHLRDVVRVAQLLQDIEGGLVDLSRAEELERTCLDRAYVGWDESLARAICAGGFAKTEVHSGKSAEFS